MGSFENLSHQDAVEKISEIAKNARTCMFCTDLASQPFHTRPMAIQDVDESGNLWFLSSRESNKNFEILEDNRVQLLFADQSSSTYLSVYGVATIFKDRDLIETLWSPIAKAWFDEGKDDPDVTVIRVVSAQAYYWDTKDGKLVTLLKIAVSAITGVQKDGGVQGNLLP